MTDAGCTADMEFRRRAPLAMDSAAAAHPEKWGGCRGAPDASSIPEYIGRLATIEEELYDVRVALSEVFAEGWGQRSQPLEQCDAQLNGHALAVQDSCANSDSGQPLLPLEQPPQQPQHPQQQQQQQQQCWAGRDPHTSSSLRAAAKAAARATLSRRQAASEPVFRASVNSVNSTEIPDSPRIFGGFAGRRKVVGPTMGSKFLKKDFNKTCSTLTDDKGAKPTRFSISVRGSQASPDLDEFDRSEAGLPVSHVQKDFSHCMDSVVSPSSAIDWGVEEELSTPEYHTGDVVWSSCCYGMMKLPMMHPQNTKLVAWTLLGLLFVFWEVMSSPVYLAFEFDPQGFFWGMSSVANIYFLLDLVNGFLVGYLDKAGNLVTDPKLVTQRYLKGTFVLDFIAGIPWEWLHVGDSMARSFRIAKIRVLRVVRIARLLRAIRLTNYTSFGKRAGNLMDVSPLFAKYRKLVHLLILAVILVHWLACSWYFVGISAPHGWVSIYLDQRTKDRAYTDLTERYFVSLYFIMTTMTTVGYGDMSPSNFTEMVFAIVVLCVTCLVFGWLTGSAIEVVCTLHESDRRRLEKKVMLHRYMYWRNFPLELRTKVQQHLMFLWDTTRGYDVAEEEIKQQLPPKLRSELSYHVHGAVLESAPFLRWLAGYGKGFRFLATKVETLFFDAEDYLFVMGSPNVQILMLMQGSVRLSRNDQLCEMEPWGIYEGPNGVVPDKRRASVTLATIGGTAVKSMGNLANIKGTKMPSFPKQIEGRRSEERLTRRMPLVFQSAEKHLRRHDLARQRASRIIQAHWKDHVRRKSMVTATSDHCTSAKVHLHKMQSSEVGAPAYFGESCLWQPMSEWDQSETVWSYNATCKTRVEVLNIPRKAIKETLRHFSPWLEERFEFFRKSVAAEMERDADPCASEACEMQSTYATYLSASILNSLRSSTGLAPVSVEVNPMAPFAETQSDTAPGAWVDCIGKHAGHRHAGYTGTLDAQTCRSIVSEARLQACASSTCDPQLATTPGC